MAALFLKEFRCLHTESPEGTFVLDAPYFLMFKGRVSQPAEVNRIRDTDWDGAISSGKFVSANKLAFSDISQEDIVFALLVEKNDTLDIAGDEYKDFENLTKIFWSFVAKVGFATPYSSMIQMMKIHFAVAANANADDDSVGWPQQVSIHGGPALCPIVYLHGKHDGVYKVRFEVKAST